MKVEEDTAKAKNTFCELYDYIVHWRVVSLESACTCNKMCSLIFFNDIVVVYETYDDMVECEECGEWFYLKCMHLQKMNCGFVTNVFFNIL